jgi:hypothetical protein
MQKTTDNFQNKKEPLYLSAVNGLSNFVVIETLQ